MSRGGLRCSLGDAQPPASGAAVSIELRLGDVPLNPRGKVGSATPGGEMGIEFTDISSAAATSLEMYLGPG